MILNSTIRFKRILLATAALVLLMGGAAEADCDRKSCPAPGQRGKMAMNSRVITREVAPSTEHRRPADEVLVLPARAPDSIEQHEKDTSHFVSGRHQLADGDKAALDGIVAKIGSRIPEYMEVVGYADVQQLSPEAKKIYGDNRSLSKARAQEVANYLQSQPGWAGVRIAVSGLGDALPTASCTKGTDMQAYQQCLAGDRRTELRVWYKVEQPLPPLPPCKDQQAHDAGLPFRISIDGEAVAEKDTPNAADVTRCTDVALEKADIQVRFDGLEATPVLNVTAWPEGAVRGEETVFTPYTNYAAFITRAEVRIFEAAESTQATPLAVLPVPDGGGEIKWQAPLRSDLKAVQYLLRVYDAKGRFDETTPKTLDLLDERRPVQADEGKAREVLTGYGENHIGISNIPVNGGAVTVNGEKIGAGDKVLVMGLPVPVDAEGKFAIRQILPEGDRSVAIVTEKSGGERSEFNRNINVPSSDWFYVGMADLTVGLNDVKGPAALVIGNSSNRYSEDLYADGRLAYYLKGKVRDGWLLTSSADTQERPIEDLFSNFDEKDPRALLRRLDPNAYYPVYGDDSTLEEDAPTRGKFFLKIAKDDTQLMWGNFQTKITGTDLLNYSRALYGAQGRHGSKATTQYGEKRTEVDLFAADPGTLDAIEEFRGTGGSLYYLRNQDITIGSEKLRIEVRDQNSGIVLQSKTLVFGTDYDINYIQGRVILREPLASTSDAGTLVLNGTLGGNPAYLVAGYEFTPGVTSVDNMTKGGRASHWLNDYIRLGVSGYDQNGTGTQQTLLGGDFTLRYKPGTYIKAEAAKSEGPGTGGFSSQNGGYDFGAIPQTSTPGIEANAQRVEAAVDIAELTDGSHKGKVSGYWVKREDGFSSPGQLTNEGVEQAGAQVQLPVTGKVDVIAKADFKDGAASGKYQVLEAGVDYRMRPTVTLSVGARHDDRDSALAAGGSAILAQTGKRTDAIVKLGYAPLNDQGEKGRYEVYALAQATLDHDSTRSGNDRFGGGGRLQLNDRLGLSGEITGGDGGLGGKAGLDYTVDDRTSHYINYLVDNGRTDTGTRGRSSTMVAGTKSRYSDSLSVFSEERYLLAEEGPSGLIHAFGLDYAPTDRWTWGAKFENGTTSNPATGDLERTAVSLSTGYKNNKVKYGGKLEWRDEDGNTTGERTSWLTKNTLSYQTSADWRTIGGFNMAISDAGTGSTLDANFTEVILGLGYRPTLNDRLNALMKYSYLSDLGSPGQLSSTGGANPYEQRSHVFSGDAIYDLTPKLSLGGKLGYRFGELRDTSLAGSPWFESTAWLAIGRADWHVVHEWDITGELRYLDAEDAEDAKAGALLGVYKHLNENVKFGVGYNFTDFSDDLTNMDYTSQGFFINIIGAM